MLVGYPAAQRMRSLDVGIVGCGTAGPAAALFLARQGHRVSLYERFESPRPIGAGIILQPTGQHVLERLGLLDEVEARGARLDGLVVHHPPAEKKEERAKLIELEYADVSASYYGVGLHRGVLFESLFNAVCVEPGVTMRLGMTVDGIEKTVGGRYHVVDSKGLRHGPHDLIIAADGARSRMRDDTGITRASEPYPWGALWFVARDPEQIYRGKLHQVVDGTRKMLGMLPTGLGPASEGNKVPLVSVYYSIAGRELAAWRKGFGAWKDELARLEPKGRFAFEQIDSPEEVLFSSYHDVVMHPWNTRAVVHLGDAAHAMSPQLGQGANLALWDAMVLADCIDHERQINGSVVRALDLYSRERSGHLGYYQWVTRALTPFFQSDHDILGWMRDLAMPPMAKLSLFRKAMVMGMCGTADGHPWKTVSLSSAGDRRRPPPSSRRKPRGS